LLLHSLDAVNASVTQGNLAGKARKQMDERDSLHERLASHNSSVVDSIPTGPAKGVYEINPLPLNEIK
jgi:hypothetical protein